MPRYASSIDVARLAGVSQSSVSRTYRAGASVSIETRQKVLAAAEALGYRPSMIPQIMLNHRSYLVALVIGGMYNPFYASVLEEFTVQLHATGHQVLLVHVDNDHSLDSVIPRLAGYRVDAIVSALAVLSPEAAGALARFKIPVVSFNTQVKNEWVSSISSDNKMAGAEIADHFIAQGARSFGYVTGPADSPASADRLKGFRDRLAARGYDRPRVAAADFRYEGGRNAILSLIRRDEVPEAIFCANDLLAMGAIDAIHSWTTLRVPHDILVAGFDDIPMASWAAYDLTTFVQNAPLMVTETIRILQSAEDAHAPMGEIDLILPARMVERGSTRGTAPAESRLNEDQDGRRAHRGSLP
jgi:DNA-binding LacI/PurR family transcriptional regulator